MVESSLGTKRNKMAKTVHLSEVVVNLGAVNWSRLRLISSIKCDNEQHLHHLSPAYSHKLHYSNNHNRAQSQRLHK